MRMRSGWSVLKSAVNAFSEDRVPMMGAALAYYAVFSLAPLLVIVIAAAGLILGKQAGTQVFDELRRVVGPDAATAIHSMVHAAASKPHAGVIAAIVGVVVLLVGASGVFVQLQQCLDIIWKVEPASGVRTMIRQRLASFFLILPVGAVLVLSMLANAAVSSLGYVLGPSMPVPQWGWSLLGLVISGAIAGLLFAAIFKTLPDVNLRWNDVAGGALVTGLLFGLGEQAIGFYLARSGVASAYGAAGSLIAVLLWVYYSAQIVLTGAELTRAMAEHRRARPQPKPGARRLAAV